MEFRALVTLGSTEMILGLSSAELTKVLGGLGDYIFEELEGDAAEWFTWLELVE